MSFVAFCFSMTVGAFWEIFEYAVDGVLHTDMQKDTMLFAIHSVKLGSGEDVTHIRNITKTVIYTADGATHTLQGYLDVGLTDTMKDVVVNALGAILFCVIGYLYLKRKRGVLAAQFIPVVECKGEATLDTE